MNGIGFDMLSSDQSDFKVSIWFQKVPSFPLKPVPKGCGDHLTGGEYLPVSRMESLIPGPCQRVASPARGKQPSSSRIFRSVPEVPLLVVSFLRRCNKTKGFIFPIVRQMTHLVILACCSRPHQLTWTTSKFGFKNMWKIEKFCNTSTQYLIITFCRIPVAFVSGPASGVAFRGSTRRFGGSSSTDWLLTHAERLSFLWVGSCGLSPLSLQPSSWPGLGYHKCHVKWAVAVAPPAQRPLIWDLWHIRILAFWQGSSACRLCLTKRRQPQSGVNIYIPSFALGMVY